jgi:hypothetical protein
MRTFKLKKNESNPVARAAACFGGWTGLARALNERYGTQVRPCHVYQWSRLGAVIPKYVLAVSELTGIPREELRPGYFPTRALTRPARRAKSATA